MPPERELKTAPTHRNNAIHATIGRLIKLDPNLAVIEAHVRTPSADCLQTLFANNAIFFFLSNIVLLTVFVRAPF